jgi:phage protein F-like protein
VEKGVKLPFSLAFVYNGIIQFIPVNTIVQPEKVIAGLGTNRRLRIANALVKEYGGSADRWQKVVGTVKSDRLSFDIHWYSHVGLPDVRFKIKSYQERGRKR